MFHFHINHSLTTIIDVMPLEHSLHHFGRNPMIDGSMARMKRRISDASAVNHQFFVGSWVTGQLAKRVNRWLMNGQIDN